ncbi:MAG: 50S ribosomal protein L3 [Dethiobacteria bacterium]
MKKAILGKKLGMTQIFDENGQLIPVTVLEAGPCVVLQKKTVETDGYQSIKVGFLDRKEHKTNKPLAGQFKAVGVKPKKYIREFRLEDIDQYEVGQEIKTDIFKQGEYVDVTGISRGKGFAGSIKRHDQARGAMSHGSHYHRGPGSLGAVGPARVFKGQALPGRMGGKKCTVQKLQVVEVDPERNLLLVKGAVPGSRGGLVAVKNSL